MVPLHREGEEQAIETFPITFDKRKEKAGGRVCATMVKLTEVNP